MMYIPSYWAGRHDCELYYSLTERCTPRSLYTCVTCGGTIYLHDEQWADMRERAARTRARIDAIPLEPPARP